MAKQCRFCLDDTETELNPLIEPCICRGSVRYVHQRCLFHWIIRDPIQNGQKCSICRTPFTMQLLTNAEVIPQKTSLSLTLLSRPFLVGAGIHCIAIPFHNPPVIQALLQIAYIASFIHNGHVNNVKIYWRVLRRNYASLLLIVYTITCMQINSTNALTCCMYINLIDGMIWRLHLHTLKTVNEVLYEN